MPVFYFLVALGAILLWLLLSFLYKPIGKFTHRILTDVKENMELSAENDKKEEE